jgi:uncharacterized DUF497 family protein
VGNRILALEWDDHNINHVAEHGITDIEIDQMLSNTHILVPNKGHEPRLFLVGVTNGGRILTVVVEPTRDEGTWRPVTAWDADDYAKGKLGEVTR